MQNTIPITVISENNQIKQVLDLYINEFDYFKNCVILDKNELLNKICSEQNYILVADITKDFDETLEFIFNATKQNPLCNVIALSDTPSVDVIVKAIRSGAKEFISMPVIKTEFQDAISRIYTNIQSGVPIISKCKTISVFSNKGGIGKTSIASNLALQLAQITKEKVALLDFNFQSGDITTFMNINPTFDISYLLQNTDKLNDEFLMSILEKYQGTSLYILAEAPYLKSAEKISAKQIENLINVLKKTFSYIVIDTEATFEEKNITALAQSDVIFLVTVANLPALRNSQRCLDLFDKLGLQNEKIKLLLNRYMENDEVRINDVEKVIGQKIYWKIPNNYFTMMSSINKGMPVCIEKPESNVAKSYCELAQKLTDDLLKENLLNKYEKVLK